MIETVSALMGLVSAGIFLAHAFEGYRTRAWGHSRGRQASPLSRRHVRTILIDPTEHRRRERQVSHAQSWPGIRWLPGIDRRRSGAVVLEPHGIGLRL